MTERTREPDVRDGATVYETDTNTRAGRQPAAGAAAPRYERDVVTPVDRIRWGPIIAGLFTAMTTLILLSVAGLALGLAQFDTASTARSFGIGSGIWGAVTWLLSFGLGGWVAARTAALAGRSNGLLNGAMVGVVAIPLILYLLGSLITGLLGIAGSTAATTAQTIAPAAGQAADDPEAQGAAQDAGQDAVQEGQQTAEQLAAQAQQNAEQIADTAATAAGGALLPLLAGLIASTIGGAIGARKDDDRQYTATA